MGAAPVGVEGVDRPISLARPRPQETAVPTRMSTLFLRTLREDPADAANAWLKANAGVLDGWLDGVTTKDGGDAMAAVKGKLGL